MSDGPKKSALVALLDAKQDSLAAVLPTGLKMERFRNAVQAAVAQNDRLQEAFESNKVSFYSAVHRAAAMGLEPGNTFGHFYLVPFKNNKAGTIDTVPIVGYKGLMELARRHPMVAKINAHVVYQDDEFEYDRATDKATHPHKWEIDRSDKALIGVYMVATLVHPVTGARETVIHLMSRKEVEVVRKRSPAANKKDSPWNTDFQAMALKSVIRRAMSRGIIPMAAELLEVMQHDEQPEEIRPADVEIHNAADPQAGAEDYSVVPDINPEHQSLHSRLERALRKKANNDLDQLEIMRTEFVNQHGKVEEIEVSKLSDLVEMLEKEVADE